MTAINVKKTTKLKISGKPSLEVKKMMHSTKIGLCPSAIDHIKPKLLVKEGQEVNIGTPLFFDKRDDRVQFLSPAGGKVTRIIFGERRRIDGIEIEVSQNEAAEKLEKINSDDVKSTTQEKVVNALLKNGVWTLLRSFPFKQIANPDVTPENIIVSIDNDEPFLPESGVFLRGKEDVFRHGIALLKLIANNVVVTCKSSNTEIRNQFPNMITHTVTGSYPATDPGVTLYHIKHSQADNKSWFIHAHDLILLAESLLNGQHPTHKMYVVAGSKISKPQHYFARIGVPISSLVSPDVLQGSRIIAGGVLTGRKVNIENYFGLFENAIHILPEGKELEILSFLKLGFKKPSISKTFFSQFFSDKEYDMNTNVNGGDRSCISCGVCTAVCPVDLNPDQILKSLVANDTEDAVAQGFLDCVECGLCTYACPSKINLDSIFRAAKTQLLKELSAV